MTETGRSSSGRGGRGRGGRGRRGGRSGRGRGRSGRAGRSAAKQEQSSSSSGAAGGTNQQGSMDSLALLSASAVPFQPSTSLLEPPVEKSQKPVKSNIQDTNRGVGTVNGKKKHNDYNTKLNTKKQKEKNKSEAPLAPSIPPNQPQTTNDINYGKGERILVLHIAEKPSIGQAIARGLASSDGISSGGKMLPVHEFSGPPFPKAPKASKCIHRVTSVAGHVFSVDFPAQFQSWDSVDPAELFDAPVVKKPTKGSTVKHLQEQSRGVNFICLWMDCDREGENINFEVLDCCMHLMQAGGSTSNYDRVYRAYFSAINPSDIMTAYNSLGKPDKNQSQAVDARQELDLKVGVAFSRFQTRYFQGRYGDLDSAVLSYGPCQTPTLGFCVQRHVDIETFKPEPYWTLELGVLKRGRMLRASWSSGRSFNKKKVENLLVKCTQTGATAKVSSVVVKDRKQGRPVPLNTVALLKACSKALGIGPHAAMQTAERLYLSGYLSYPRTESSAYPKSFDIRGALQMQTSDNRWGNYVRDLLREGHNTSRGGFDAGDHPPITPCRSAGAGELFGDSARVYDLVVRHFIASVSQDAVWRATKIDFEVEALGDEGKFSISGKEIVSTGFLTILLHKEYGEDMEGGGDDDEEERVIPEFQAGESIPLLHSSSGPPTSSKVSVAAGTSCWASLSIKEKMTTPPSLLTESELIGLMEKYGIGTDASIATHIENILKRKYAVLESGRRIGPSKLGLVLVQGYHQIDSGLVLPKIRSDIEDQCTKVAKGLARKDDVVRNAVEIFHDKFEYFVKHISRMDVLFGSSFSKLEDIGKPFTRCGKTRRYLQFIQGPPSRLYNRFTEEVYPLPAGGMVREWTGRACSVVNCSFELCLYTVGQPPRTFPLCPNCFNSADWALTSEEDSAKDPVDRQDEAKERQVKRMAGKALTLECPLPDDHPLIAEMTVSPDPDSGGVFIVDPHLGPKWRLVSTRDPTIVYLPQIVNRLTILNRTDEVLGCHLIRIEFKPGESPLESGETKYTCCFATDELLQGLVRVFHGSERLKASGQGGRGCGRGGRRGRAGSRGRGRRR